MGRSQDPAYMVLHVSILWVVRLRLSGIQTLHVSSLPMALLAGLDEEQGECPHPIHSYEGESSRQHSRSGCLVLVLKVSKFTPSCMSSCALACHLQAPLWPVSPRVSFPFKTAALRSSSQRPSCLLLPLSSQQFWFQSEMSLACQGFIVWLRAPSVLRIPSPCFRAGFNVAPKSLHLPTSYAGV